MAQFSYLCFYESEIETDFSYRASFMLHYIIVTYEKHTFHNFLVVYNLRRYSFLSCFPFSEISIFFVFSYKYTDRNLYHSCL
jgi:hypothetical protein